MKLLIAQLGPPLAVAAPKNGSSRETGKVCFASDHEIDLWP